MRLDSPMNLQHQNSSPNSPGGYGSRGLLNTSGSGMNSPFIQSPVTMTQQVPFLFTSPLELISNQVIIYIQAFLFSF